MTTSRPGPIEAIRTTFRRSLDFRGRSRRSEYWWFFALWFMALALADTADDPRGTPVAKLCVTAVLGLPMLAVAVRRLHDTDRSAWGLLITMVPIVGGIIFFVWLVGEGTLGPNRFGPSPKGLLPLEPSGESAQPPPLMRLRTHLDADGRLIGHEYVDEDGNVITRD